MPAAIRLDDIVEALEVQFDEHSSFLDLDTGQVETVSDALLREAEESSDDGEPDLPAWERAEWEIAKRIVSTRRFEKLPTKFEVHEWAIMEAFHAQCSPIGFVKISCAPSTAQGRLGISRTPFGGTASNQHGSRSAPPPSGKSHSTGAKRITSFGSR